MYIQVDIKYFFTESMLQEKPYEENILYLIYWNNNFYVFLFNSFI
jgi:hypothetical protein